MNFHTIHTCLDCNFTGRLNRVSGTSQCPRCGSRAVWPVSSWSKPECLRFSFHAPKKTIARPAESTEIKPTFLGGTLGHQQ